MARPSRHRPLQVALALALLVWTGVQASDHTGQVTAPGVPVPGAIVTATSGDTTVTTSTNLQGDYALPDLADGTWTIRVEMPGFAPVTREVTVGAGAEPVAWELALLPFDEIASGNGGAAPNGSGIPESQIPATVLLTPAILPPPQARPASSAPP